MSCLTAIAVFPQEGRMASGADGGLPRDPGDPATSGAEPEQEAHDPNTLELAEENLSVGKETVETGRVRVRVATQEHTEDVEIPLEGQHVEVERVAIGQEIDAIPARRQEGDTTIIPVVEERVVTARKLVLKEEIHVKLVHSSEQHRESVVLRRQEAVVERVPMTPESRNQERG